ncbi:hypothetical protein MuYL_4000 [Mucilaginibacter xinganensis]|uniref:Uncharacterized protein n=1 Tax=Mucilaginibacter xinganensis TaxID=1234841 RepID=A0A223P189_9SPHI|nr:hypothetical protein MuYL_4000 [Mucilaginibacter xinganensis]
MEQLSVCYNHLYDGLTKVVFIRRSNKNTLCDCGKIDVKLIGIA